jgi:hypothetical protein
MLNPAHGLPRVVPSIPLPVDKSYAYHMLDFLPQIAIDSDENTPAQTAVAVLITAMLPAMTIHPPKSTLPLTFQLCRNRPVFDFLHTKCAMM